MRTVNRGQTRALRGNFHPLARPEYDRGEVDPGTPMSHLLLLFKPSAAQQSDLDQLLVSQQNPSSPNFHKWLTPEEFGDRFGLSASDTSKVVAWLRSEGLTVKQTARGRNWLSFGGTAAQVSRALGTSIHRYDVNGETHIANASEPSVPEAIADVAGGFMGLDDFHLKAAPAKFVPVPDPSYNRGAVHYLVPEDFATIYDVAPLYQAGYDGAGQSIAIVGASDILISDIRSFRTRYNLPANDPRLVPYDVDPGFNGNQVEANLDLEWAGAIAPRATIYYIYGPDPLIATIAAVDLNAAPIISVSFGNCEIEFPSLLYRTVAQQGNAQGITTLTASGDTGAAGCDRQGAETFATRGKAATFPANLPEVTGVGGTQFNDANGNYWAATNTANSGSALSWIPEVAWNESAPGFGLAASSGGVSFLVSKPDWQAGPGVPQDGARDIPDVAMAAAVHTAYFITYQGGLGAVGGTSASSPSLAGILALLNQYQVKKGFQNTAGLGNVNPQLYRLAQSAPGVFHDIAAGDNIVPCAQGTPDCLTGSYGYTAGPGYDLATGLGSIDGNNLVIQWNTAASPVIVTLTTSPAKATVNDDIQLTATVAAASGSAVPTGTVNFLAGSVALGSATLSNMGGAAIAGVTIQASQLGGVGSGTVTAVYSGDAAFSGGSALAKIQITKPAGVAAILASVAPNPVYAAPAGAQGLSWQTILTLSEIAGVPSAVTSFAIDGQQQTLANYFPSTSVPANGVLTADLVFRDLPYPVTKTFTVAGVDSTGATWTRTVTATFLGPQVFQNFNLTASPLTMQQNTGTPGCEFSQKLILDETGGFSFQVIGLQEGNVDITDKVLATFGTTRLAPWGSLQGTLCWNGVAAPATDFVLIALEDDVGNVLEAELSVSFAAAGPAVSTALAASPSALTLPPALPSSALLVNADKSQGWTATVSPGNRTTGWLRLSRYSGTGPATIVVTGAGTGFENGVYRALITIEASGGAQQSVTVPVMYVLGGSGPSRITGVSNAISYKPVASPGEILAVFGSQLSDTVQQASTQPLPFTLGGVSATVNGVAAPLYYVSPNQLNVQVPYETGAGPAVIGINNNGRIVGFQFQVTPTAPAIAADAAGTLLPTGTVAQGKIATLYMTGDGDVTPALVTGASPLTGTPAGSLPHPRSPVTVTIGGTQAFLQFIGIVPGVVGLTQVNFTVPSSVPVGNQSVVVTVGGVPSPAVNLAVTAGQ
ncbi:MAG TPA: protease pro-enzyme activation domain-containing protein [Bryobacteraceae bacterium]|nr:protease pro-enzyme activation domain-containing protein [Bryobacteraceae bacterium]